MQLEEFTDRGFRKSTKIPCIDFKFETIDEVKSFATIVTAGCLLGDNTLAGRYNPLRYMYRGTYAYISAYNNAKNVDAKLGPSVNYITRDKILDNGKTVAGLAIAWAAHALQGKEAEKRWPNYIMANTTRDNTQRWPLYEEATIEDTKALFLSAGEVACAWLPELEKMTTLVNTNTEHAQ